MNMHDGLVDFRGSNGPEPNLMLQKALLSWCGYFYDIKNYEVASSSPSQLETIGKYFTIYINTLV